jgi:hypothetical protein
MVLGLGFIRKDKSRLGFAGILYVKQEERQIPLPGLV